MWVTPSIFLLIGLLLVFLPVRTILRFDRKLGYAVYQSAPNEVIGLRWATYLYRAVGMVVFAYSVWFLLHVTSTRVPPCSGSRLTTRSTGRVSGGRPAAPSARGRLAWFVRRQAPDTV